MVPFLEKLHFLYIQKKNVISNYTFFGLIHFSGKMMLKKTKYKRKPENIYFGLDKPTQDRNKKHMPKSNILYIHGYVSKRGVFFWFLKGFFERKKGHLILRQPSPPHTLIYIHNYRYKYKTLHTHIYI